MKKFLEVLVDEDGRFHFSTEEAFVTEEEFASGNRYAQRMHMEQCDARLRQMVQDLTDFMWRTKDQRIAQAIRLVSMAEILGCAQPYERAEEFWDLMMFNTIPQLEEFAADIKGRYGFDNRTVTRPVVGGSLFGGPDFLSFPIPQSPGKMSS